MRRKERWESQRECVGSGDVMRPSASKSRRQAPVVTRGIGASSALHWPCRPDLSGRVTRLHNNADRTPDLSPNKCR
jgi:hypothetical protein